MRAPGGTGVGAAVSVNYADVTNQGLHRRIHDQAGGLVIQADTADRNLQFDPSSKVDTANDTIDAGSSGLRTGDAVAYNNGGGTDVGGLSNGTDLLRQRSERRQA